MWRSGVVPTGRPFLRAFPIIGPAWALSGVHQISAKHVDFEKKQRLGPDGGHAKGVIPMFIEDSYP